MSSAWTPATSPPHPSATREDPNPAPIPDAKPTAADNTPSKPPTTPSGFETRAPNPKATCSCRSRPAGRGRTTTLSLSKADRLEGVSVVDGAGGLVWDGAGGSSFADGQRSFQYQVHDDTQDLFVAAKAATSVSVSAAFAATSVPQATATTPSDSAASGLMHSGGVFPKGLLVGVVVGIIMWV